MILKSVLLFCALLGLANSCNVKRISSKLICYYSDLEKVDNCYCTHVVLPANTDVKEIDNLRKKLNGVKILLTVHEFNQGLVKAVKQNTIDGLELNLKKLSSKEDVTDFISTVRTKLGNDLFIALSIPPKTELLAKYYDLKALTKSTDVFILQTSFLGASKNVTFHPSRLSGMWDMQNTDSVVDLVTGLGAPLSRLVITAPVQAFQFRLQDSSLTTPGSPALEIKTITRKDLCDRMNNGESWILERDQDQAGPYIFRGSDWIAFEDTTSLDIKAKYTRVRGMAGLALKDVSQDLSTPDSGDECGSLLQAAHAGLSKQNRVPRGAVLRSLEREILETPAAHLQRVEVSPYRITRIVDTEGHVHSVRKDTRTEFTCSRQGYFVHPSSCGRFYRCVKFDQLSNDFNVFEFDCPAGLAFDERVEVCVWPGSLPHGGPCQGSSEIAPVPRQRFRCPQHAGYYVDPENCRWFFACLDHGQSELVAYEFRCPFGLVFDEQNLLCQWPWLVPSCGISGTGLELDSIEYYGGGATLVSGVATGQIGLREGQLDSYDGLGNLGVVALGGYQGDINLLKNSLQSHGVSDLNLGVNAAQAGQNSGILQTNILDNSYIGLSGINSGLNLGVNLDESALNSRQNIQSGIGLGHISTSGNAASSYSNIENSGANIALNSGQNIQSNIGLSLDQLSTSGNAANSYSNIENSGANIALTSGQNIQSGIGLSLGQLSTSGNSASSYSNIENSGANIALNSGQNIQSGIGLSLGQISTSGNGASSYSNIENSAANLGLNSGINVGLNLQGARLDNTQDNLAIVNEQRGHRVLETSGLSGLSSTEINLGLLDNSRSFGNIGVSVQDSGLSGNLAASAININNQDNDQAILVSTARPVEQTVLIGSNIKSNLENEQLLLNSGQTSSNILLSNEQLNANRANSYQSIHHIPSKVFAVEVPVQSVQLNGQRHSGTLDYNYQYANEAQYVERPIISQAKLAVPVSHSTTLTHIGTVQRPVQYAQNYIGVTPRTDIFVKQYRTKVQPVIQPVVQSVQPVVLKENARSHSYSSIHQYQTPVVQKVQSVQPIVQVEQPVIQVQQAVQPVVHETVVQQPVLYGQKVLQSERAKSNSYSSIQHYTTPIQNVQTVVEQPVEQVQKIRPIVQQPILQQHIVQQPVVLQSEHAKSNSYSSVQHYQTPVVQLEQKVQPIVQETIVQQPVVYGQKVLQTENQRSNSYSSIHHYQRPVVQLEQKVVQPIVQQEVVQQPIVYEQREQPVIQKVQTVQPVVLQSEGARSNSYSSVQHYTTPVVQKVQPIVQQEIVQQPVVVQTERPQLISYSTPQPIVQQEIVQQPIVYEQRVQPVVQKVQTVQPVIQQNERAQSNSYSTVQHYTTPVVQKVQPIVQQEVVQQPIVYEQRVQPVIQKAQPVILQNERAQSNSYSTIQHYTTPVVQKVQPIVQQEVVQQPIVYERVQPIVQTERPQIISYSTPRPIVQQEIVQQPIVYEQRVQPVVQKVQPVVVQTERPRINSYSSIQHFTTPVVQKGQPIVQQEIVQQPIVYEQRVQPVVQKVQPVVVQTERPQLISYTTPQPIVQQEFVQQPIVYEQRVQKVQPVRPIQPVVYEQRLEQPVVQQEVPLGTYRYYDSRYDTSAQNQYLEQVVSVTPTPQIQVVSPVPKVQPVQPIVFEQRAQPVVQKAHTYQSYQNNVVQPVYGTPVIPVARRPTVTPRYESYVTPTVQPITYEARVPVVEPKIVQKIVQPLYVSTTPRPVSTYYVSTPRPKPVVYVSTTPKYAVFQEYVQPKQTFEIQKVVQPVAIKRPVVQPTIVESYNYVPSKVQEDRQYLPPVSTTRTYLPARIPSSTPKIAVLQPVQKVQPTVISEYSYENPEFANYESNLNFNSVQDLSYENVYLSTERPISTAKAVPIKSYQTDLILTTPRPTFVSTIAPIVKQTPVVKTKVVAVNKFQTYDDQYFVSTPKPIYISTPVVPTEVPLGTFRYYDSRYDTSAENQFLKEVPITSTIRPVQRKKIISTTTEVPLNLYDYDQFDSQYIVSTRPTIATTYRPRNRYTTVQSTTPFEDIEYVTTQRPRITTIPVVQRKKITTTFIPEYEEISTVRPVKITPRPQTVVRVNDFHPFLTTKLGAQCVCTSNTLKIKSRPQEDQEYDVELPDQVPIRKITSNGRFSSQDLEEPGVYVVDSTDYDEYEPRKVVPVTKSPIRTTTNAIVPAPTPVYTIRRKTTTRPIESSTASQIVDEVFIRKSSKEEKIAEAVNEGLKAIKGIVKEAVREEVRNFDRYGPGGWRSREETLQGSVDCQRAGLFRHPTQCNKFYACHWDCTKQRYTLHVFNCPVHLTFDTSQGACNWPSKGPACTDNTLLPSS